MRLRDAQKWPRSEIKKSFVYFLFISTRVTHFSVFLFAREQIFQARGIKGGCKRIKWEKNCANRIFENLAKSVTQSMLANVSLVKVSKFF